MAEEGWGEDEGTAGAPRKRRFPKWLWWSCGCGCLLLTVIAAAFAFFAWRTYSIASDPEQQWPKLAEVLPFDERPAHLELELGIDVVGMQQFHLEDPPNRLRATVFAYPVAARSELDKFMDPAGSMPLGLGRLVEPEKGTMTVQGREVPVLRFARLEREPEGLGAGIHVDLSDGGPPRGLELRRIGTGAIEDADVETFLVPFDVWRGR